MLVGVGSVLVSGLAVGEMNAVQNRPEAKRACPEQDESAVTGGGGPN